MNAVIRCAGVSYADQKEIVDVEKIRRQRLRMLIDYWGDLDAAARNLQSTPGALKRITKEPPSVSIGKRYARQVERRCGLPAGWMDGEYREPEPRAPEPARNEVEAGSQPPEAVLEGSSREDLERLASTQKAALDDAYRHIEELKSEIVRLQNALAVLGEVVR